MPPVIFYPLRIYAAVAPCETRPGRANHGNELIYDPEGGHQPDLE